MKRFTDEFLVGRVNALILHSETHAAALLPLGITPAMRAELIALRDAFTLLKGTPKHIQNEVRTAGQLLRSIMEEQNALLATMDLAVEVLHHSAPDFAASYTLARQIVHPSYHTRALTVLLRDGHTGARLVGVKAHLASLHVTKTTGLKGMFFLNRLRPGMHTFTFSKEGYAPTEATIAVDGHGQKLEVQMAWVVA